MPADRNWRWPPLDEVNAAALIAPCLTAGERSPLVFVGEGEFCIAFRSGRSIVRVARSQRAADALRREACFLASAAMRLPLRVPRPVMVEDPRCPPFAVHDAIDGDPLTRNGWEKLTPAGRERAVAGLAAFLRALHGLPPEVARRCGVTRLDAHEFAADLRSLSNASIYPLLNAATCRRLDGLLKGWAEEATAAPQPESPLHCDLSPGHILFDRVTGDLAGIIDFGDLALGDPARDFVGVAEGFGETAVDVLLVAYAGNETAALKRRIRQWSLLELTSWCVDLEERGEPDELADGVAAIETKVAKWDAFEER